MPIYDSPQKKEKSSGNAAVQQSENKADHGLSFMPPPLQFGASSASVSQLFATNDGRGQNRFQMPSNGAATAQLQENGAPVFSIQNEVGQRNGKLVGDMADIKAVQSLLAEKGYLPAAEVDGYIGKRTVKSISAFLVDHGLDSKNPIISPSDGTFNKLANSSMTCSAEAEKACLAAESAAKAAEPKVSNNLLFGWNHVDDGKVERERKVGGWTMKTDVKKNGLFGGETNVSNLDALANASEKDLEELIAQFRMGAYGDIAVDASVENGAFSAKSGASGSASLGMDAKATAKLKVQNDLMEIISGAAEAGVDLSVKAEVSAYLEAKYGPVGVKVSNKLDAAAGLAAKAGVEFNLGLLTGVKLKGSASAKAEAKVNYKSEVEVKLDELSFKTGSTAEVALSARAEATGDIFLTKNGLGAGGKLEFFSGAEETFSVPTGLSYKGKELFSLTGTFKIQEGAGAKAEGKFGVEDGKITIKLGASAAFLLGAGLEGEVGINPSEIAAAITDVIYRMID